MKTYLFYYIDGTGKRRLQMLKAQDAPHCIARLSTREIVPIGIWRLPFLQMQLSGKISTRLLALFFSQLAMALHSGVGLLEALEYMEREQSNERMRALLVRLKEGIMTGRPLSECVRRETALPPMIGDWIAIGEKQGRLVHILDDVATHLEKDAQMKKQLQQQLLYPLVVLAAIVLVGLFLAVVVMPMMARQFMGATTEGTGLMRAFLAVHDFFAVYGGIILLGIFVATACIFIVHIRRKGSIRPLFRETVLRVPILKKICVLKVYVPFARFMGQMLSSGVPADDAMGAVEGYFNHSLFAEDVGQVKTVLIKGGSLSLAISEATFVPDLAKQMLLNGERYGRMPEALLNSADYYESTLLEELGLVIRFVEPLAVAALGILVLIMALGLFLPVLDAYRLVLGQ